MMRAAVTAVLLAGCSINVDYTGTYFHCNPDGSCPPNFRCRLEVCVPDDPAPPACATTDPGSISAGGQHACAIRKTDNTVWCWGRNDYGQLGNGEATDSNVPVQVIGVTASPITADSVYAGDLFSCALDHTGAVFCWGHNDKGQLGNGPSDSRSAVMVAGLSGVTHLAVGRTHVCAVLADKSVDCWGSNTNGELGDGGTNGHMVPQPVPGLSNIDAIAAGENFSCSVDGAGDAKCWGWNDRGQLGTGDNNEQHSPTAVKVVKMANAITTGSGFACASTMMGIAWCWGNGPLGNSQTNNTSTPILVESALGLHGLTAGYNMACGLDGGNRQWCWGNNDDGRFGDGDYHPATLPVLSHMVDSVGVAAGGEHMCAVDSKGAIRCAGNNRRGELGDGHSTTRGAPQDVPGLTGVKTLAGGGHHICALMNDMGKVQCWGYNNQGQLGVGAFDNRARPTEVIGLQGATAIAAGDEHTCALLTDALYCWGNATDGRIADGTPLGGNYPQVNTPRASFFGPVSKMWAGERDTCVITNNQSVCVGAQFGVNATNPDGVTDALWLSTGYDYRCEVAPDHTVHCAGNNDNGQLATGDQICCGPSSPNVTGVAEVFARGATTCTRGTDGSVNCWGLNQYNQTGTPGAYRWLDPKPVAGLNAQQLALGFNMACALKPDNTVACWGLNGYGAIGDGTYQDRGSPVPITSLSGIKQIVTGDDYACVLKGDTSVACWGNDYEGELGDGTMHDPDPVGVQMQCP